MWRSLARRTRLVGRGRRRNRHRGRQKQPQQASAAGAGFEEAVIKVEHRPNWLAGNKFAALAELDVEVGEFVELEEVCMSKIDKLQAELGNISHDLSLLDDPVRWSGNALVMQGLQILRDRRLEVQFELEGLLRT